VNIGRRQGIAGKAFDETWRRWRDEPAKPAFDQNRGSIFIPATESSSIFTKLPPDRVTRVDNRFICWQWLQPAGAGDPQVLGLNAATDAQKWEYPAPSSADSRNEITGLLSTDRELAFGASGGVFFALDADTGREVWRRSLGGNTKFRSDFIYGR
jgi:outer membrane protein assembly factor BamB